MSDVIEVFPKEPGKQDSAELNYWKRQAAEKDIQLKTSLKLLRAVVTRGDVLQKQDAIDAAIKFLSQFPKESA